MKLKRSNRPLRESGTARAVLATVAFLCFNPSLAEAQPNNSEKTVTLLRQGLAAEQGGYAVPVNFDDAFRYYRSAAELGSPEGKARLGYLYLRGSGVPQDLDIAIKLITEAAATRNPVGLRFAGVLCEEGTNGRPDLASAKEFYEQAIKLGDAPSNGRLGMMYLFGRGVTADRQKGQAYLEEGSRRGDVWSQIELGRLYYASPDPQARGKALTEYARAAKTGNRIATFRLGAIYEAGELVPQDLQKAFEYYSLSAQKGYPLAQVAMGRFCMRGIGGPTDYSRAYIYLLLAKDQGQEQADGFIRQLNRVMTSEDVERAKDFAEKVIADRRGMNGSLNGAMSKDR